MQSVQPVYGAVFRARPGEHGEGGGGGDGIAGDDRLPAVAEGRGAEAFLQREAFEASRLGIAAAPAVRFAARFADEYRDEVSGQGGSISVPTAGELAQFAESARAEDGGGFVDVGGLTAPAG